MGRTARRFGRSSKDRISHERFIGTKGTGRNHPRSEGTGRQRRRLKCLGALRNEARAVENENFRGEISERERLSAYSRRRDGCSQDYGRPGKLTLKGTESETARLVDRERGQTQIGGPVGSLHSFCQTRPGDCPRLCDLSHPEPREAKAVLEGICRQPLK